MESKSLNDCEGGKNLYRIGCKSVDANAYNDKSYQTVDRLKTHCKNGLGLLSIHRITNRCKASEET